MSCLLTVCNRDTFLILTEFPVFWAMSDLEICFTTLVPEYVCWSDTSEFSIVFFLVTLSTFAYTDSGCDLNDNADTVCGSKIPRRRNWKKYWTRIVKFYVLKCTETGRYGVVLYKGVERLRGFIVEFCVLLLLWCRRTANTFRWKEVW
jgi:hypothetical protein